jgi:hypothetical protein
LIEFVNRIQKKLPDTTANKAWERRRFFGQGCYLNFLRSSGNSSAFFVKTADKNSKKK